MNGKDFKILLIEPPFNRLYNINASLNKLPLSLGYLAAMIRLKKPAWEVKIYNSDFSPYDASLSYGYLSKQGFDNYLRTLGDHSSLIWREIEGIFWEIDPNYETICKGEANMIYIRWV